MTLVGFNPQRLGIIEELLNLEQMHFCLGQYCGNRDKRNYFCIPIGFD